MDEPELRNNASENIQRLMGMHLIRQDEVALFVGISRQSVNNLLKGRTEFPSTKTLSLFAHAFGVRIDDLMGEPKGCLQAAVDAFDEAPLRLRQEVKAG